MTRVTYDLRFCTTKFDWFSLLHINNIIVLRSLLRISVLNSIVNAFSFYFSLSLSLSPSRTLLLSLRFFIAVLKILIAIKTKIVLFVENCYIGKVLWHYC